MKKVLVTSLSMMMVLTLMTGCGCNKKTSGPTEQDKKISKNTSKDVVKDQVVEGIKMTNTSMVTNDGVTTITVKVTNNTGSDYKLNEYVMIMKDKDGKEIRRIPGYIGSVIKNGEVKEIKSTTNVDLSDVVSIEYEVKK